MAEKNMSKLRLTGLQPNVSKDDLKGAIAPLPDVGGEDAVVRTDVVPGRGGALSYVLFGSDEAAAAAFRALGAGETFHLPGISNKWGMRVQYADKREPESSRREPDTTPNTDEVAEAVKTKLLSDPELRNSLFTALKTDPTFRGKDGKSPTKDEVAATLKIGVLNAVTAALTTDPNTLVVALAAEPALRGALIAALKNDAAFKSDVKGEKGENGVAPTRREVVAALAAELRADAAFKTGIKGEPGENGKSTPKWSWITGLIGVGLMLVFSFTALVRSCGINTPHVPSKREIAAELKTDPAFKAAVKGNDGKSAVAPTAAEVATALKADAEFAKSVAAAKSAEPTATTTTPAPEAQTATAPPTTEQEQTRRPPRREPARQPTFVNYEGGGLRVQYRLGDFAGQLEEVERRLVRMNSRR